MFKTNNPIMASANEANVIAGIFQKIYSSLQKTIMLLQVRQPGFHIEKCHINCDEKFHKISQKKM
jgi:hypothetical protein